MVEESYARSRLSLQIADESSRSVACEGVWSSSFKASRPPPLTPPLT